MYAIRSYYVYGDILNYYYKGKLELFDGYINFIEKIIGKNNVKELRQRLEIIIDVKRNNLV